MALEAILEPLGGRLLYASSGVQAVDIAMTVAEAIRDARRGFRPLSVVHLFMAVPIGLAVLIGQSLNTLGPVQTYEHVSIDGTGIYRAAARLTPSE